MQLKSDLNLLLKVVATYIGAVVGAGFASGQEIMQFFIVFGPAGLWGVILSTILFAYLGALIMLLSVRFRCANYRDLFNYLLGPSASKIMDVLSLLMLAGGLGVMLAGSGAVFSEQLGLPSWIGSVATGALTCLVLMGSLQGVLIANVILVPLKIGVIILVTLAVLLFHKVPSGPLPVEAAGPAVTSSWIWSAVLYVSYNMIVPVAVLSSLGRSITPVVAVFGGVLGGIGMGITAGLITLAGLAFYPMVLLYEIPLLYIAGHLGEVIRLSLSVLIWLAILTTAIANAHGFASRLAPELGIRYRIVGLAIVGASFSLSGMDFSYLVSTIYPLFGYAGLILLAALIMVPVYRWLRYYGKPISNWK